jgi:uncharacterized membrane protein YidH (DUF202 family)
MSNRNPKKDTLPLTGGDRDYSERQHTAKSQAALETDYGVWFNTTVLMITLGSILFIINKPLAMIFVGFGICMQVALLSMYAYISWGNDTQRVLRTKTHSYVLITVSMAGALILYIATFAVLILNTPA